MSQIIGATGEKPSIAKRLRMQYGKKDSEGNTTNELVSEASATVLIEWETAVKEQYGPDAVDSCKDSDLYVSLPTNKPRRKKGRIFGFGTTRHAFTKLGGSSLSQQSSNEHAVSQSEDVEKNKLVKEIAHQKKQIASLSQIVCLLASNLNCEIPSIDFMEDDDSLEDDPPVSEDP